MKINIPMTALDYIYGHRAELTLTDGNVIVGFGKYLGESPISDDSDEDAEALCFVYDNGESVLLFNDEIKSYKLLD